MTRTTLIDTIEHVIPYPDADDEICCAHCGRTLAGPDTIARSAVIANHDHDYLYCDRECAEDALQKAECDAD